MQFAGPQQVYLHVLDREGKENVLTPENVKDASKRTGGDPLERSEDPSERSEDPSERSEDMLETVGDPSERSENSLKSLLQDLAQTSEKEEQVMRSDKIFMLPKKPLLPLFGEDSLALTRQKISLALGVPCYRLLLYTDSFMFFTVIVNGINEFVTDPDDIFRESPDMMFGCPIDIQMSQMRGLFRIETTETFTMLSTLAGDDKSINIYCLDLMTILEPNWKRILSSSMDQQNLLYYGFVCKYWPMISSENWTAIVGGMEQSLQGQFPNLFADWELVSTHTKQVIELTKAGWSKRAQEIQSKLDTSITFAEVNIINSQPRIDIIALFNAINTNINIPLIILMPSRTYQAVRKSFPAAPVYDKKRTIKIPPNFKKGIVIVYSTDLSKYLGVLDGNVLMFINIQINGQLAVITKWREDFQITFDKHVQIMKTFINPIIEELNAVHGTFMYSKFPLFDEHRINFRNINVSLYWRQTLTLANYKELRARTKEYVGNGIFEVNRFTNFLSDIISYDFVKAGTYHNPFVIDYRVTSDTFNYYSWMWNLNIARLWFSTYHGFQMKAIHRSTDLHIDISNINPQALELFKHYYCGILAELPVSNNESSVVNFKKRINKLNYLDHLLFKFVKEQVGGKNLIYSVVCQAPKQPIIYNPDEVGALSATEKKKLTEYWNFTYNRPAYYRCPNPKYPHLAFQVGVHPDGYCLPCCQKLAQTHHGFYYDCLNREKGVTKNYKVNKHILHYSEYALEAGRIGYCPVMQKFLEAPVYLAGVIQEDRFVGVTGLLNSILIVLRVRLVEFVKRIVRTLADKDLIRDLIEVLVKKNPKFVIARSTEEMHELWLDVSWRVFGINIVIINIESQQAKTQIGQYSKNAIIIEKQNSIYEPLVQMDTTKFVVDQSANLMDCLTNTVFSSRQLKSVLIHPTRINQINYDRVPRQVVAKVVFSGTTIAHVYQGNGGEICLPPQYQLVPAPPETPILDQIPYDRLKLAPILDFIGANNIQFVNGIQMNGDRIGGATDKLNRVYYFSSTVAEYRKYGPIESWGYDLNEIYRAYYRGREFDTLREQIASEDMFFESMNEKNNNEINRQMAYRNLIYLFILVLSKEKNSDMRDKIVEAIKNNITLYTLGLSRNDINSLMTIMMQTHKKVVKSQNYEMLKLILEQHQFDFDEAYFIAFRQLSVTDLKARIKSMIERYVHFTTQSVPIQPIYYDLSYYEKNLMTIYGDQDKMLNLLIKDIHNPLMYEYFSMRTFEKFFTSKYENIDYSRFTVKPGEKLELAGFIESTYALDED
jgi:hypothetical protein